MRGLAAGFVLLAAIAACASTTSGSGAAGATADPYTKECTQDTVADCQGKLCLTLEGNTEGKTGVCSASCTTDAQCTGGICLHIANGTIDQSLCFRSCQADGDCANGFACIQADTSGRKICLVHAVVAGTKCTESSECTEAKAVCTTTDSGKFCTGALDAPDVFQRECKSANDCPGLACLTLKPNKQQKAGLCTLACTGDGDCPNGICASSPFGKYCVSKCQQATDCDNGFVCLPPAGDLPAFCGVESN